MFTDILRLIKIHLIHLRFSVDILTSLVNIDTYYMFDTPSYIIHIPNNTKMNCIKFEKMKNNVVSISTN